VVKISARISKTPCIQGVFSKPFYRTITFECEYLPYMVNQEKAIGTVYIYKKYHHVFVLLSKGAQTEIEKALAGVKCQASSNCHLVQLPARLLSLKRPPNVPVPPSSHPHSSIFAHRTITQDLRSHAISLLN
jgi:hypothetical protein